MRTKEEFAAMLEGRPMGSEITKPEEAEAKQCGLVIVFGYSDDNVEFRGAITDEIGAYEGRVVLLAGSQIHKEGEHEGCECPWCGYDIWRKRAKRITAVWGKPDRPEWTFETDIPHATFTVVKEDRQFCRGIVFEMKEVV